MDELLAVLRALGAEVKLGYDGSSFPNVNGVAIYGVVIYGVAIYVDTKRRAGKVQYQVGDHKFVSAKNCAHFILTEWLPKLRLNAEIKEAVERARVGAPKFNRLISVHGTLHIHCDNLDELRAVVKHLAEHL